MTGVSGVPFEKCECGAADFSWIVRRYGGRWDCDTCGQRERTTCPCCGVDVKTVRDKDGRVFCFVCDSKSGNTKPVDGCKETP